MVTSLRLRIGRRALTRVAVTGVVTGALMGSSSLAEANEFTINACQADRANFSTQAFEDFATRGMMWKRACDPEGPGLRGLVTANVVRAGRVRRGARSFFVMRAPDGTRFGRLNWSGQARRRDCRYALQLWASRPDGPPIPIKNVRANRGCPRRGYAQAAGWPRARSYDINGTTSVVQRVVCVGSRKTPYCSSRGLNYIRTFKAQATVVDVTPPAVSIVQDNPFTRGEWVRGRQMLNYVAADNVGVRLARAVVGGLPRDQHSRECDYARRAPCTNDPGTISVDTSSIADGSHHLVAQAEDAAGNSSNSAHVAVRVDNTAPGAVSVAIEGGAGWRNQNGFDLTWQNPDEVDRAPIAAAYFRLCRSGSNCTDGYRSGLGIERLADVVVPGPGEWQLRAWRKDAAGNEEPANASVPVYLRYDPEPPQVGFETGDASDPTLVSVVANDKVSGLAGGQIELSRVGSATWQAIATDVQRDRLVARIDDASLPPGTYQVRATARDQAGNQSSADRWLDGQPMVINLPLRVPTALHAGVVRSETVRKVVRRGRKRRSVRRRIEVTRPRARVAFGSRVRIRGRLEDRDGHPIPGAEVQVLARTTNAAEQLVRVLHTDAHGRYSYLALASSSRVLRFVYNGTAVSLPAQSEVTLLVRAASTLRAQPRRLLNGQVVRFIGKLRSLPVPPAGKLIELQVILSGRWQTFRTTLTDAEGLWRVRYRFRRSCGLTRYRFRARLPAEAGYIFETGLTRPVQVRVRGGPCG